MLPIGVLIPTRNSAPYVPQHLADLAGWIGEAQEVIVVDSFSKDGTVDLIKAGLKHPNLKIIEHPPGLYQSWNHGIRQIKAEYCYISTVGESITLAGVQHLAEVMGKWNCDVVVSKPDFIDEQGNPMPPTRWPIDDMVETLGLSAPAVLEGPELFLFTLVNYREAILGSSASNLYRSRCVQANSFPVDYGTAGDGGWGLTNCLKIRLGVTPRKFSTFREHPKAYSRAEYAVDQLGKKMFDQICKTYREHAASDPAFAATAKKLRVDRIIELLESRMNYQHELEAARQGGKPWALNPAAWNARARRNARTREVARLKGAALETLRAAP
jgi:glycosyltransferase involved in cell wall biosynthesis